jgi:hypothetical protein
MKGKASFKSSSKRKNITIETALKNVGQSARIKAFRKNQPVVISIEGVTYLIYPDGYQVRLTDKLLQQLGNV